MAQRGMLSIPGPELGVHHIVIVEKIHKSVIRQVQRILPLQVAKVTAFGVHHQQTELGRMLTRSGQFEAVGGSINLNKRES